MKKIKLLFVIGAIFTMLSACGSSASAIVGRWQADDIGVSAGRRLKELEFFSDGTYNSNSPNYSGSYTAEDGRLRISGILMEDKTYSFEVSGGTLKLFDDSGKEYDYSKIN